MTECEEIAESLAKHVATPLHTLQETRLFVIRWLPEESPVLQDNVAEALLHLGSTPDIQFNRTLLT